MHDVTVSANVDTMMRAANNAAIRSAIGLGQTDAPTFLAQSLTGQSLTGTQATSLVDLVTTWNTTGTPSAITLNVTDTASNAASKLLDLQVGGVSRFFVNKDGLVFSPSNGGNGGGAVFGGGVATNAALYTGQYGIRLASDIGVAWSASRNLNAQDTFIFRDGAPGILAQRNGTAKQTLRIYNTYTSASIYERAVMDWNGPTPGNLQIGTEFLGSGSGMTARPIDFVTGGVVRMTIAAAGNVGIGTATPSEKLEIWGNSGQTTAKITSVSPGTGSNFILSGAFGQVYNEIGDLYITNNAASSSVIIRAGATGAQMRLTTTGLLQLGGTTSAFPAIKRNGTGIDIRLADDSAFAPVKGKLTTDTAYTATTVVATGYITLYDSTGTAYRVPCAV